MKISLAVAALLAVATTVTALPSDFLHNIGSRRVSNETLANFLTSSANGFFPAPGNDGWDVAFDKAFARNVTATFNDNSYNFTQFKAYFAAIKANLEKKYQTFDHSFTSIVAVSAAGGYTGGYGVLTGIEGGLVSGSPLIGTDAAFGVVREIDGELKITEVRRIVLNPASQLRNLQWHEITNLGAPVS